MHSSVMCTFGQKMYQEFNNGTTGCSQAESRMVCGHGRAQHSVRLVGSRDNTKHMELHWEGVRVGLLCGLASSSWSWKAPSDPTSLLLPLHELLHPPGAALPLLQGGTTTCRDSHRKGAAEGPCYPDLEQCRPSPSAACVDLETAASPSCCPRLPGARACLVNKLSCSVPVAAALLGVSSGKGISCRMKGDVQDVITSNYCKRGETFPC